jgi:hypothetical protein
MDLSSGHSTEEPSRSKGVEVDAEPTPLKCQLLLYRSSGAHAAAAEQYVHYADRLRRELDVEAPPLESL